jgi:hypothetical protein
MTTPREVRNLQQIVHNNATHLNPAITERIAKAIYRAGWRPAVSAAAPDAVVGQAGEPGAAQGMLAHVVHTIPAEQVAEHGVDALTAWIRQALRDGEKAGADPRGMAIALVPMADGTVVVTAEAAL